MGVLVEITDPELVAHELNRQYCAQRLSTQGERCHLRLELDELGPVRLHRISLRMTYETEAKPLGAVAVGRVREGRLGFDTGGRRSEYGAGDAFVSARADEEFRAQVDDLEADYVTIPPALIDEVVEQPGGAVRFTGYEAVSPAAAHLWKDTFDYAQSVAASDIGHEPLVAGSVARLLVTASLAAFPNTARPEPQPVDRRDAHPAALRRALSFIEANAQHDISPADVAGAAYVSIRAVQLAFRRHLGTTPMGYVRRIRLEHVHRELLAADPGRVTVGAVAARWGFTNHSRFADYYRRNYGVPPSRTLHH